MCGYSMCHGGIGLDGAEPRPDRRRHGCRPVAPRLAAPRALRADSGKRSREAPGTISALPRRTMSRGGERGPGGKVALRATPGKENFDITRDSLLRRAPGCFRTIPSATPPGRYPTVTSGIGRLRHRPPPASPRGIIGTWNDDARGGPASHASTRGGGQLQHCGQKWIFAPQRPYVFTRDLEGSLRTLRPRTVPPPVERSAMRASALSPSSRPRVVRSPG